jgi:hypothetical protein
MVSPSITSISTSVPRGMLDFGQELWKEDWDSASRGQTPIATDHEVSEVERQSAHPYSGSLEVPHELGMSDSTSHAGVQDTHFSGMPYSARSMPEPSQDPMSSGPFYASLMGGGSYVQSQPISPSWTASSDMEAIMTGSSNLSLPHDLFSIPTPFTNQAQCVGNTQSYDIAPLPVLTLDERLSPQAHGTTGYLSPPGSRPMGLRLQSPRSQFFADWDQMQHGGSTPCLSFAVPPMRAVGEAQYQLPLDHNLLFSSKVTDKDQEVQVCAVGRP